MEPADTGQDQAMLADYLGHFSGWRKNQTELKERTQNKQHTTLSLPNTALYCRLATLVEHVIDKVWAWRSVEVENVEGGEVMANH